jgi:hypothetical protein
LLVAWRMPVKSSADKQHPWRQFQDKNLEKKRRRNANQKRFQKTKSANLERAKEIFEMTT